jgi:hypothetical protein
MEVKSSSGMLIDARVARWQDVGMPPRSVQRNERRTYAWR